ncbi:DinB family protein [Saccharibacillus sp. CPCC 101409]|uniref:DinB family protein n=1 Tax=Saccharibacillus sp. CPCC 101409 TaxID=3058041 RepID=UPI002671A6BE|nr:DinB family protein [Saccharibacillus sp. CPCC 101409]MDO3412295.1 DinB family protein [Saccharibacillus sp. CPCC 101409]
MTNAFVFKLMDRAVNALLKILEDVPENARGIVPDRFNNNLHWQVGHIVTVADRVVNGLSGRTPVFPQEYPAFFAPGTKPADWQGEAPAWDELVAELRGLPDRFRADFGDKPDEPLANPDNFAKAETLGDLLMLNVSHMNNHLGMVNAMARIARQ